MCILLPAFHEMFLLQSFVAILNDGAEHDGCPWLRGFDREFAEHALRLSNGMAMP